MQSTRICAMRRPTFCHLINHPKRTNGNGFVIYVQKIILVDPLWQGIKKVMTKSKKLHIFAISAQKDLLTVLPYKFIRGLTVAKNLTFVMYALKDLPLGQIYKYI